MDNWQFHAVAQDISLRVVRPMPPLPAWLEARVDAIWESEQARLGGVLFNGRVFSADIITPHFVYGHWTEYRRIVAQMRRPDLHTALAIRPVAVGGVILGPDGLLFGRRPERAVYQAGEWQLPPAGNVDPTCARAEGLLDPVGMLLVEMAEELGLPPSALRDIRPIGFAEHPNTHLLDLGMAASTDLSAADMLALHAEGGNAEYGELVAVSLSELPRFLATEPVTGQAEWFLAELGLIAR